MCVCVGVCVCARIYIYKEIPEQIPKRILGPLVGLGVACSLRTPGMVDFGRVSAAGVGRLGFGIMAQGLGFRARRERLCSLGFRLEGLYTCIPKSYKNGRL